MQKITGPKRLYYATLYSWKGVSAAYSNEPAFRYEISAGLLLVPASFLLAETPIQWGLLMLGYLAVIIMELLNTAIEAVVDRAGREFNEMAGLAKDLGSACVFFAIVLCIILWGAVALENGLFIL